MCYRSAMSLLKSQLTAWVVLLISLMLTGVAWQISSSAVRSNAQQRFHFQTKDVSLAIAKRLQEYETALRAGVAFFNAADRVDRAAWRKFVAGLDLQQNFPGLQGLGFSQIVLPGQLQSHVEKIRQEGFADYSIRPAGERDLYTSIIYLEPFDWRNQRAFGYDMNTEVVRRDAMERARDTGQPAVSGRVRLLQETDQDVQYGFLMYMPVYRKDMPVSTLEERRAAIQGFIYSPVRANNFMQGIFDLEQALIDLELYDGESPSPETLLYDSRPGDILDVQRQHSEDVFEAHLQIPNRQRMWTLHLLANPNYLLPSEKAQPKIILVGGALFDLLVFYLVVSIAGQKRQLEKVSQNLKVQLQESELVLRSAIETIGEAFVVYDKDDRLTFFNEEYRQAYKTSAPMIEIGRSFEEIIRYGAERGQYSEAEGQVEAWVANRLQMHQQGNTQLIQRLDDGRWLKIRERKTPAGHIVGFRVDVTEFYQAKEAAESASKAKSQFLATMSHEIRTPMNGILGMAQILLATDISVEERLECARTILRSGQTLLTLLNDILDLAKVEAGKFDLTLSEISPVRLVRETVGLFEASAHLKQLRISADASFSDQQYFMADANRLRQMLANLVGNAIKFTWQGDIRVEVHQIESTGDNTLLEFAVSDTGIGIPVGKIPRLFEPFSQLDGSVTRQHGGSGLGLSIVQNLARLMGGEAGVTSEEGKGSRFWFRVRVQALVAGGLEEARKNVTNALPVLSGHILVAEDDAVQQKLILAALKKLGLTARLVENGQQAVDAVISSDEFDLILMDISMPVLDGHQATESILLWQKEQQRPALPIVALTANAYAEDRRRSAEAGMVDFLAKPIDFRDLAKVLDKWLPDEPVATQLLQQAPVDIDALVSAVNELIPLLAQHKFDAFGRFKALKALVAESALSTEIDQINRLLNTMEFELVIERLRQLVQSKGRSLSI